MITDDPMKGKLNAIVVPVEIQGPEVTLTGITLMAVSS